MRAITTIMFSFIIAVGIAVGNAFAFSTAECNGEKNPAIQTTCFFGVITDSRSKTDEIISGFLQDPRFAGIVEGKFDLLVFVQKWRNHIDQSTTPNEQAVRWEKYRNATLQVNQKYQADLKSRGLPLEVEPEDSLPVSEEVMQEFRIFEEEGLDEEYVGD